MHRLLKAVVIEDDDTLRHLFAENLRADLQIQTAEAGSLAGGLALCRAERQLVLLVDLGLPDANGIEAVPVLRKAVPAATLVVVTGDDTLRDAAITAGAHAAILKGSPESHGAGLIKAVRTAVMNHDLEMLNAAAANRLDCVSNRLDAAKKLLPLAAWVALSAACAAGQGASAADDMRREGEANARAWWADQQPGTRQ